MALFPLIPPGAAAKDNSQSPTGPIYAQAAKIIDGWRVGWSFNGQDWYKTFGFQFVVKVDGAPPAPDKPQGAKSFLQKAVDFISSAKESSGNSNEILYTLPIPPQVFSVQPVHASKVTPTIGGVVEETSATTFWMISMEGTTGISPSRSFDGSDISAADRSSMADQFRDNIGTTGLLSGALAGANAAINKIGGFLDRVTDAVTADTAAGAIGAVTGAINTALTPALPYAGSAVNQNINGHTEALELMRFLYTYSQLKEANPTVYSLYFRSHKTGQEWRVVVENSRLLKSSQDPMLYKYSISLRGWDVRPIGATDKRESDRMKGDLKSSLSFAPAALGKIGKGLFK